MQRILNFKVANLDLSCYYIYLQDTHSKYAFAQNNFRNANYNLYFYNFDDNLPVMPPFSPTLTSNIYLPSLSNKTKVSRYLSDIKLNCICNYQCKVLIKTKYSKL